MLYDELAHRKVLRVPGRKPRAQGDRRGRDKTIGLAQRDPKERRHVLANAAGDGAPLMAYPLRGIGIPLVSTVRDLPKRRHDVIPPALILQRSADRLRNERAS